MAHPRPQEATIAVQQAVQVSHNKLFTFRKTSCLGHYRKVASSNMSRFEARAGLFKLSMRGIFDAYVL